MKSESPIEEALMEAKDYIQRCSANTANKSDNEIRELVLSIVAGLKK